MPVVCRFHGITIYIYFDDHNPPHFHAVYAGKKAVFRIDTLERIEGSVPKAQEGLIVKWAYFRRKELYDAWQTIAINKQQHTGIKPIK